MDSLREISSLEEYISIVKDIERGTFYRGVSRDSYKLIPSLGRLTHSRSQKDILEYEDKAFRIFKSQVIIYGDYSKFNDLCLLLLAQHHGLPTRLMDWTLNPLVALFFSVKQNYDDNPAVYILKYKNFIDDNADCNNIIGYKNKTNTEVICNKIKNTFKCYLGKYNTPRMQAQNGIFTLHYNPFEPIKENFFEKIIIKKEQRHTIYQQLEILGIHEHSLFPSVDGLATWIKRTHLS